MESLSRSAVQRFVQFVYENDCQILANRREAQAIFNRAILDAGGLAPEDVLEYPIEKLEKIQTFLSLLHSESETGSQVNVYAFVRLVGELRRRAAGSAAARRNTQPRRPESVAGDSPAAPSTTPSPSVGLGGGAYPESEH